MSYNEIASWAANRGFEFLRNTPPEGQEDAYNIYCHLQKNDLKLLIYQLSSGDKFCAMFNPRNISGMIQDSSLTALFQHVDAILLSDQMSKLHAELLSVLHHRVTALETHWNSKKI